MMNFIDPSKMLKTNKKSVIKTWIITIQELWRKERYLIIEIIWKKRKVFKSHRLSERQRITHKELLSDCSLGSDGLIAPGMYSIEGAVNIPTAANLCCGNLL